VPPGVLEAAFNIPVSYHITDGPVVSSEWTPVPRRSHSEAPLLISESSPQDITAASLPHFPLKRQSRRASGPGTYGKELPVQLYELPGETPVDDGPVESRGQREAHSARRRTQMRADRRRNAERRRELSGSGTDSGSDRAEGLSFDIRGLQQSLAESIHRGIRELLALLLAEQRGISGTIPEGGSAKRVSWHPDLEQQPLPTERELSPHPSRALSGVPLDEDHAAHASRALVRRRRSSLDTVILGDLGSDSPGDQPTSAAASGSGDLAHGSESQGVGGNLPDGDGNEPTENSEENQHRGPPRRPGSDPDPENGGSPDPRTGGGSCPLCLCQGA